jgi:hypothetical protein
MPPTDESKSWTSGGCYHVVLRMLRVLGVRDHCSPHRFTIYAFLFSSCAFHCFLVHLYPAFVCVQYRNWFLLCIL